MYRTLLLLASSVMALAGVVPAAGAATAPAGASASAVLGVWVTPHGDSHVKIYRGDKGEFYGQIVWLKRPRYPENFKNKALAGQPKLDLNNPKKAFRDRRILGLDVLAGFEYLPKHDAWGKGKCYDPQNGKMYECRMWLIDGGAELRLRGYDWIFYKTQTWTRYQEAATARAPSARRTAER